MTPERAQLIQDLARIEVANIVLQRAEHDAEGNFARRHSMKHRHDAQSDAWCVRVCAAQFDPHEEAEFQRVRAEFRALLATATGEPR